MGSASAAEWLLEMQHPRRARAGKLMLSSLGMEGNWIPGEKQ